MLPQSSLQNEAILTRRLISQVVEKLICYKKVVFKMKPYLLAD